MTDVKSIDIDGMKLTLEDYWDYNKNKSIGCTNNIAMKKNGDIIWRIEVDRDDYKDPFVDIKKIDGLIYAWKWRGGRYKISIERHLAVFEEYSK